MRDPARFQGGITAGDVPHEVGEKSQFFPSRSRVVDVVDWDMDQTE